MTTIEHHLPRTFDAGVTMIRKYIVVPLALTLLGVPLSAAPPQVPTITQLYTTAETSTSAAVVWNTNIASDSRVQYSTSTPIPAGAPQVYRASKVTVHDIELSGLTPGTLYYFRVTSCAKHGCATAPAVSTRSKLPGRGSACLRQLAERPQPECRRLNPGPQSTPGRSRGIRERRMGCRLVTGSRGPTLRAAHLDATLRRQFLEHRAEPESRRRYLHRSAFRFRDIRGRRLGRRVFS
jgi:hypothetical protein